MSVNFDPQKVIQGVRPTDWKIASYEFLVKRIHEKTDLTQDTVFQAVYNDFFAIRRRGKDWHEMYYKLFQEITNSDERVSFEFILEELYKRSKNRRIEMSFASKMLHILYPDEVIWDRCNRLAFKMKKPSGANPSDRLASAKELYADLKKDFLCFSESDTAQQCVELFNKHFQSYQCISRIKKIDFFTWAYGKSI